MTLLEYAQAHDMTDRQIADKMTAWLASQGVVDQVSVPAVQKYRTGRVPRGHRMSAIHAITEGEVTANDFFDLPTVTRIAE